MGKSSKKSNIEVVPAVASSPPVSKSAKKGKRDSDTPLEKPLIAKKQKKETVEVHIKQKVDKKSKKAPPPKKKPETSSSEDTSSDSEKEVQVAPKLVVQPVKQPPKQKDDKSKKAPPKKKLETSSSEDTSSDSEEEVDVAPKKVVEVKPPAKDSSSSEESSSDEEMKPLSGDSSIKVPTAGVKNGTALASKKKDDSSDEDSDSSESDSDEDEGNVKKTGVVSKVVSLQKKGVQDSSSGTSESESDDEEVTAKQALMVQKPPTKVTAGASNKKGELSESSERDLDDKKPQNKPKVEESSEDSSDESYSDGEEEPQKKKLKVPIATGLNASKPNAKAAKKESSSDEDEDDSSDESSDEPPKVQKNKTTKPSTKSSSSSEESAEDSSDESEDEKPMKTLAKKGIDLKDAPSTNGTSNQSAKKFPKKEEKTPASNQSASSGVKTLFVGNLSFNVTDDELVEFFKEAGEVIDIRLSKFDDGNFKGFGHVEFATVEEAQRALNKLNGQELLGRAVKLDFARERSAGAYTPSSGKENRSFQKDVKGQGQTIFVRGFDKSLEMDEIQSSLEEFFGSCGEITRISLPKDYDTGASKGIGYLDFGDSKAFSNALELNGSDLGGYTLTVEEAKPRIDSRDGGWSGGRGGGRDGGWSGGRGGGRGGRDGGWGGGRGGARGRGGGRGGRGRGGRDGAYKQSAGTPSQGRKTTFGDD